MTYTVTKPATLPTHCSNCPKFKDYHDSRGRGWCLLFERVSFKKHPFTRDCELERVASEDIIRPEYQESDRFLDYRLVFRPYQMDYLHRRRQKV